MATVKSPERLAATDDLGVLGRARAGRPLAWALGSWLLLIALPARAADTAAEDKPTDGVAEKYGAEFLREWILSVHVHGDWVFASTPEGIYRASVREKKWVRLPSPRTFPHVVFFAAQPADLPVIYCYSPVPRNGSNDLYPTTGKTLGLYRFDVRGEKWELLSSKYEFTDVCVKDGKTVYALVDILQTDKETGQPYLAPRILVSEDSAGRWKDVSNWDGPFFRDTTIFPDPDHKDLVCLHGHGHGDWVLQASDKRYKWTCVRYQEWEARHPLASDFFATDCCLLYNAKLSNYFGFPFGGSAAVSSFQVTVGGLRKFKRHEPIPLTVSTEFLFEDAGESGWAGGDPREGVKLVDTEHGHLVWGLRRVLPDGTREIVEVAGAEPPDWAPHRALPDGMRETIPAEKAVRPGPGELKVHHLTHRQCYKRSLDVSEICDFSRPGTYRVQLIYENGWIASERKGEWPGRFRSPVFEVTISP